MIDLVGWQTWVWLLSQEALEELGSAVIIKSDREDKNVHCSSAL